MPDGLYDGFEVDMLSVGNADCILVTSWSQGTAVRVLIDGAGVGAAQDVLTFLRENDISYIDHLVSTHPHDDHAGGLLELVKDPDVNVGKAWMHLPWNHFDSQEVASALKKSAGLAVVMEIQKSLTRVTSLYSELQKRGIGIEEPFQGKNIGFFKVCGPSQSYFEELVGGFANIEQLSQRSNPLGKYD